MAKIPEEFQMCPMVQRVPHGIWNGVGPFAEFLFIRGVACYIFFFDAKSSHGPPFIVIAVDPDLGDGIKNHIFSEVPRRQMVVIIYDWHF
jgi:hypothetical protein